MQKSGHEAQKLRRIEVRMHGPLPTVHNQEYPKKDFTHQILVKGLGVSAKATQVTMSFLEIHGYFPLPVKKFPNEFP